MASKKGFEQLAHELPEDERKDLLKEIQDDLKKLQKLDTVSGTETLTTDEIHDINAKSITSKSRKLEKEYSELTFFEKISIQLLKIFTKKTIAQLMEDHKIKKIGRDIDQSYPGLIDYKAGILKERFYNEITLLQNCMEIITEPVNYINKTGLNIFYLKIASSELAAFEDAVIKSADPENYPEDTEKNDFEVIRQSAYKRFNDKIASIEPEEKAGVYEVVKAFYLLNQIVSFPFAVLKKSFVIGPNGNRTCMFVNSRKNLSLLNTILTGMEKNKYHFDRLLKYLFSFYIDGKETENNETSESASKMTEKGSNSISMIINFQKSIPLLKLLRFMYKNPDYKPDNISGGEEWFTVYRQYLKDTAEKKTEHYIFYRKKNNIIIKLAGVIFDLSNNTKLSVKVILNNTRTEIPKATLLYYLLMFYHQYYSVKNEKIFSIILLDGFFYKEANKKELAEAYNFLQTFPAAFNRYINKQGADRELPGELLINTADDAAWNNKKKKSISILKKMSGDAEKLYELYYKSFVSISNILGGIITGNPSTQYDTLSNISVVCEEKTVMSVKNLNKQYRSLVDILNTFKEFDELISHEAEAFFDQEV